jgi:membrane-associated protein
MHSLITFLLSALQFISHPLYALERIHAYPAGGAFALAFVVAIIFAESGLFFGFFFPGDSLLFAAGLLASFGFFNIIALCVLAWIAAAVGDSVGYWFGKKVGPKLFTRVDSFIFHQNHVKRAALFYEKHGAKAIVLARFVPIIRTFAPIIAGVGGMQYRRFLRFNITGGFAWVVLITGAGYTLGRTFPGIASYIEWIALAIILLSIIPIIREVIRRP